MQVAHGHAPHASQVACLQHAPTHFQAPVAGTLLRTRPRTRLPGARRRHAPQREGERTRTKKAARPQARAPRASGRPFAGARPRLPPPREAERARKKRPSDRGAWQKHRTQILRKRGAQRVEQRDGEMLRRTIRGGVFPHRTGKDHRYARRVSTPSRLDRASQADRQRLLVAIGNRGNRFAVFRLIESHVNEQHRVVGRNGQRVGADDLRRRVGGLR